jgi:hypothetical protein
VGLSAAYGQGQETKRLRPDGEVVGDAGVANLTSIMMNIGLKSLVSVDIRDQ